MDVSQAMRSVDMDEIIDAMNAYAIYRLNSVELKDFNGREPIDFVGDLILKVAEGKRDWGKAQCTFREFLFGCLRSDIDNFFTIKKLNHTDQLPNLQADENPDNLESEKNTLCDLLNQEGADAIEIDVFKCWMDGITKPSEIATDLNLDISLIYKSIKRLERRRPKIQKQATKII